VAVTVTLTLFGANMARAGELQDKASAAVANVVFDHEVSDFTVSRACSPESADRSVAADWGDDDAPRRRSI
jgi:hypothetical protein